MRTVAGTALLGGGFAGPARPAPREHAAALCWRATHRAITAVLVAHQQPLLTNNDSREAFLVACAEAAPDVERRIRAAVLRDPASLATAREVLTVVQTHLQTVPGVGHALAGSWKAFTTNERGH